MGRSNLREAGTQERSQAQGSRCPPAASALAAGDLQGERFLPLAPENQHPNHVSNFANDPRHRSGGNTTNAMQQLHAMMQQQQQQQHPGMHQGQDFNLTRQRQQIPVGSPHDSSPQMSPADWNMPAQAQQQQQHQQMMQQQQQLLQFQQQFPPHLIQTPPQNAMHPQPQVSDSEGQFRIPGSYTSSTPSSTSSHATFPSSSPYHTQNSFKQDHDDTIELMQVSASPWLLSLWLKASLAGAARA